MTDHPLPQLRNHLLALHKLLMNAERSDFEREGNVITSPMHFFQLLTEHERFTWLRQLSQLVVVMDETMEEKPPPTSERMDALVQEAAKLLTDSTSPESFALKYERFKTRTSAIEVVDGAIFRLLKL
jgi:hypothetical protein